MKNIKSIALGFGIWLVSFPIFLLLSFFIGSILYPAFLEWFPDLVPKYNFVTERENYELLHTVLEFISAIITVFISSHLAVRFDNDRMERMITLTEGLYTLKDGAKIYYPAYIKCDVMAAVLIPLPLLFLDRFALPLLGFLPEGVVSLIELIFVCERPFVELLGFVPSCFALAFLVLAARLVSGISSLASWRALWLSDIEFIG